MKHLDLFMSLLVTTAGSTPSTEDTLNTPQEEEVQGFRRSSVIHLSSHTREKRSAITHVLLGGSRCSSSELR